MNILHILVLKNKKREWRKKRKKGKEKSGRKFEDVERNLQTNRTAVDRTFY